MERNRWRFRHSENRGNGAECCLMNNVERNMLKPQSLRTNPLASPYVEKVAKPQRGNECEGVWAYVASERHNSCPKPKHSNESSSNAAIPYRVNLATWPEGTSRWGSMVSWTPSRQQRGHPNFVVRQKPLELRRNHRKRRNSMFPQPWSNRGLRDWVIEQQTKFCFLPTAKCKLLWSWPKMITLRSWNHKTFVATHNHGQCIWTE